MASLQPSSLPPDSEAGTLLSHPAPVLSLIAPDCVSNASCGLRLAGFAENRSKRDTVGSWVPRGIAIAKTILCAAGLSTSGGQETGPDDLPSKAHLSLNYDDTRTLARGLRAATLEVQRTRNGPDTDRFSQLKDEQTAALSALATQIDKADPYFRPKHPDELLAPGLTGTPAFDIMTEEFCKALESPKTWVNHSKIEGDALDGFTRSMQEKTNEKLLADSLNLVRGGTTPSFNLKEEYSDEDTKEEDSKDDHTEKGDWKGIEG